MAAELIVAPEAEQDIAEAYGWYEHKRFGLGEEFLSRVNACIQGYPAQAADFAKEIVEVTRDSEL